MTLYFQNLIPNLFTMFLVSFFSSFLIYLAIEKSRTHFLSFLYIPAGKSSSNAKLLGGLGLGIGVLSSVIYLITTYNQTYDTTKNELDHLIFSIFPICTLIFSGYIDDRYEIRARHKLFFQFLAISSYAFITSKNISTNHQYAAFFLSMGVGILLINGTNLLDGLDTMTIKLGIVTSAAFFYLGLKSESAPVIFISTAVIASLCSFYFFNKEPAKIYMGEIGGAVIGFLFYIQSTLSYENLIKMGNGYKAFSWVIIAASLPIAELGISFLRRVWMKKSPFRGDKLHLHHLLKQKYNLSASNTSNTMAIFYSLVFIISYFIAKESSAEVGALFSIFSIVGFYNYICFSFWKKTKDAASSNILFSVFENKTVHILNSELFDQVSISIPQENKDKKKKAA